MSGNNVIPYERIENRIYLLRARKVMLDRDLAVLYGVSTSALNQAVRRNIGRFPYDFMFQLNKEEFGFLISQSVISKNGRGGTRHLPTAFTEQGVAMLSSVLKSEKAILVNIQIIRTFTKLREMLGENDHLRRKIEAMEKQYDEQFKIVFEAIRNLIIEDDTKPMIEIGFQDQ